MIFYIYAMVFSWFGRGNMFAVHFFSLLVTALTSFYIYRILLLIKKATHQENERTALWGACLFVCFSGAFLYEVMSANTEVFLNLFLTLSAYIFFKNYKTTKPIHSLAIGLLIAASFITKQVGGIMLPILCVGSLLKHKRALRRGVMESALITSGFMLGVALSFAFFYQKNLAHEYFYWVFWEPWSYAGNGYVQPRLLMRILTRCVAILLSWFFLWSLASRSIFNKVRTLDDKLITVVLWLIGMMFVVSLGGRFLWHYFTICVPPLAILAAPEIERTKRFWVYLGIAAPLVVFSFVFLFIDRIDNRSEKFNSYAKVADYVKKHTTANDKILVWGIRFRNLCII
jgi:4-amino-4-deoxy-L-arabinose transferase-like glycosyltransferase